MILLTDLIAFTEEWQAERGNVESYYIVASDDKLAKRFTDAVHANNDYSLVVLIPIHLADIPDEDNRRMDNLLTFMFIKKTDSKAGPKEERQIFINMQLEAKAFIIKVLDLYRNFGDNCIFSDMDLNSIRVDPVQDYLGSNGYAVDFTNKTLLK